MDKGLARFARERVTYVKCLLGNRARFLGDGGDLVHLRSILYSKPKGSSKASSEGVAEPSEAVRQTSAGSRQAA